MNVFRDYDQTWRVEGYEQFDFPTECAARMAASLAVTFAKDAVSAAGAQESRYRRAAERAEERQS